MVDHISVTLTTLAARLGATLKTRGYMLTIAESCTGGMVSQAITSVAGSSTWFDRGFITYSNAAKAEMLGVSNHTLEKFGAVCEQTAKEMAIGALKNSQAQVSASITGIAGPDGGTPEKPVGTVCFAWLIINHPPVTATKQFHGTRDEIRRQAAMFIMAELAAKITAPN